MHALCQGQRTFEPLDAGTHVVHGPVPDSGPSPKTGYRKLEDLLRKGRKFDFKAVNKTCVRGLDAQISFKR